MFSPLISGLKSLTGKHSENENLRAICRRNYKRVLELSLKCLVQMKKGLCLNSFKTRRSPPSKGLGKDGKTSRITTFMSIGNSQIKRF